jgi:hypothetical protein
MTSWHGILGICGGRRGLVVLSDEALPGIMDFRLILEIMFRVKLYFSEN